MKSTHLQWYRDAGRGVRRAVCLCVPAALALAVLTGCSSGTKPQGTVNPAGTYALTSVDGKNVPCALEHEGHALTIKSGSFVIAPGGTCASKIVFSPPSGAEATREVKATYTQSGTKLTMRWQGAGVTEGTVEGDTFTMNNEGMIFRYRK